MFLSVLIPMIDGFAELPENVTALHALLTTRVAARLLAKFEIIVILGDSKSANLNAAFAYHPSIRIVLHDNPRGRGAALRTGFAHASGNQIAICDPELPFGRTAIATALDRFTSGIDLVSANRNLEESSIAAPVNLVPRLARRHRDRLRFHAFVQFFLPLQTSDTQAGLKILSRRLAEAAFALQSCDGFLSDLELFMIAKTHYYGCVEIPVRCENHTPRSSARAWSRVLRSTKGMMQLAWRHYRGRYQPQAAFSEIYEQAQDQLAFSADDWGITPGVNAGILRLAQDGVIKRVSILANSGHVFHGLRDLLAVPNIELGLHFNLTLGRPSPEELAHGPLTHLCDEDGNYLPLRKQLVNIVLAKILPFSKRREIFAEINQAFTGQLQRLQAMQIPLSYFDGHHHIHLSPFVLPALKEALSKTQIRQTRLVLDPKLLLSSRFILYFFSLLASRSLNDLNLEALSCIYPRLSEIRSPKRLLTFAKQTNLRYEIITHPALRGDLALLGIEDDYDGARVPEYLALARYGRSTTSATTAKALADLRDYRKTLPADA